MLGKGLSFLRLTDSNMLYICVMAYLKSWPETQSFQDNSNKKLSLSNFRLALLAGFEKASSRTSNRCKIMVHIAKWHLSNCTYQTPGQAYKLTDGTKKRALLDETCDPSVP